MLCLTGLLLILLGMGSLFASDIFREGVEAGMRGHERSVEQDEQRVSRATCLGLVAIGVGLLLVLLSQLAPLLGTGG